MAGTTRRNRNGTIRELPGGRWQLRLKVPGSLPPVYYPAPSTFALKSEAQAALRRHNASIDSGSWKHPDVVKAEEATEAARLEADKLTVAELAEEWLAARSRAGTGLGQGTLATYRSRIAVSILPTLGEMRASQVTSEVVAAWFHALDAESRHKASVAYDRLVAMFAYAVKSHPDLVPVSPCQVPGEQRLATNSKGDKGQVVPDETIREIAAEMPDGYGLIILLAGWCGLREGEVLALSKLSVEQVGKMVTLNVEQQSQSKGGWRISDPKSRAGNRRIPVAPWLRPLVVEQAADADPWLFPGVRDASRPLSASTLDKRWTKALEHINARRIEAGADPITARFHDLRHTALTRLGRQGATLGDLKLFGGHSSVESVAIYQRSEQTRLEELTERMG